MYLAAQQAEHYAEGFEGRYARREAAMAEKRCESVDFSAQGAFRTRRGAGAVTAEVAALDYDAVQMAQGCGVAACAHRSDRGGAVGYVGAYKAVEGVGPAYYAEAAARGAVPVGAYNGHKCAVCESVVADLAQAYAAAEHVFEYMDIEHQQLGKRGGHRGLYPGGHGDLHGRGLLHDSTEGFLPEGAVKMQQLAVALYLEALPAETGAAVGRVAHGGAGRFDDGVGGCARGVDIDVDVAAYPQRGAAVETSHGMAFLEHGSEPGAAIGGQKGGKGGRHAVVGGLYLVSGRHPLEQKAIGRHFVVWEHRQGMAYDAGHGLADSMGIDAAPDLVGEVRECVQQPGIVIEAGPQEHQEGFFVGYRFVFHEKRVGRERSVIQ